MEKLKRDEIIHVFYYSDNSIVEALPVSPYTVSLHTSAPLLRRMTPFEFYACIVLYNYIVGLCTLSKFDGKCPVLCLYFLKLPKG